MTVVCVDSVSDIIVVFFVDFQQMDFNLLDAVCEVQLSPQRRLILIILREYLSKTDVRRLDRRTTPVGLRRCVRVVLFQQKCPVSMDVHGQETIFPEPFSCHEI